MISRATALLHAIESESCGVNGFEAAKAKNLWPKMDPLLGEPHNQSNDYFLPQIFGLPFLSIRLTRLRMYTGHFFAADFFAISAPIRIETVALATSQTEEKGRQLFS
jgi:hypothetical protein